MLFSEFVDINPKVPLDRGSIYPCVMMDEVQPGKKYVSGIITKPFKGGAKFQKGDTLFARITPCLENGKIAKYTGHNGECGFGSTEFFVFRAKDGFSDSDYVYYLALSDILRKPAEASMFGASGRQRADLSVVESIEIEPPPLPIQRKIASILSAYDDLIENNIRRIKVLEEMAQRIYREWFVDFRFPGYENHKLVESELGMIPEGWEVKTLGDVFDIKYGKGLPTKKLLESGEYPVYGAGGVIGYYNEIIVDKKVALITCRGNGSGTVWRTREPAFITNNSFLIIPNKEHTYLEYHFVEQLCLNTNVKSALSGSAQPQITITGLSTVKCIIPKPDVGEIYCDSFGNIAELIDALYKQNKNLRQTRDLLLPKLISGELDVSEMDIEIGEGRNNAA